MHKRYINSIIIIFIIIIIIIIIIMTVWDGVFSGGLVVIILHKTVNVDLNMFHLPFR